MIQCGVVHENLREWIETYWVAVIGRRDCGQRMKCDLARLTQQAASSEP